MGTHFSYDELKNDALATSEFGPKVVTIRLEAGDTAYAPGTTKYNLLGFGDGGTVTYRFYLEGIEASVNGHVSRSEIAR